MTVARPVDVMVSSGRAVTAVVQAGPAVGLGVGEAVLVTVRVELSVHRPPMVWHDVDVGVRTAAVTVSVPESVGAVRIVTVARPLESVVSLRVDVVPVPAVPPLDAAQLFPKRPAS